MNESDAFVHTVADKISRHGWGSTVATLLENGQPLAFLGGQALWVAQPALTLLFDRETLRRLALLLEDPTAVDKLRQQLTQHEPNQ